MVQAVRVHREVASSSAPLKCRVSTTPLRVHARMFASAAGELCPSNAITPPEAPFLTRSHRQHIFFCTGDAPQTFV